VREDRVNRLFQPFNLLHRLNATRGLGLSLIQRLVQLEGGRAGYEPRKGGGARFYFTLPKGDATPPV
jgi:signal transduction histidine kinase